MDETKHHPCAFWNDAQDALSSVGLAGRHQIVDHDVHRRGAGVSLTAKISEPLFERNYKAEFCQPILEGLAEPLRRIVGENPIDVGCGELVSFEQTAESRAHELRQTFIEDSYVLCKAQIASSKKIAFIVDSSVT